MKKILLLLLLSSINATAQDTIVLRHKNGQPALSGPCTFFVNPYAETNRHRANLFGLLYGGRGAEQIGPFSNHHDFGEGQLTVPDADESSFALFREKNLINLLGLGFSCDGKVTLYYSSGRKRAQVLFYRSIPIGPYTEYYPDGTVAVRATLDRGMPTGGWKRYYKSGAVYATGTFKAVPAAYLQDAWNGLLHQRDALENWEEAGGWVPRREFSEEGLRLSARAEREALQATLSDFRRLVFASVPSHGIPLGKFSFLTRDGNPLADIVFDTAGRRTGVWTIWKGKGKIHARLEYTAAGELTHITDSTTNSERTTVAEYTRRWKEQQEIRMREHQLGRVPIVISGPAPFIDPMGVDPAMPRTSSRQTEPVPRNYVYTVVDQQPEFQGNIYAYLTDKLKPQSGCDGRVVVQFVVQEDGSVIDAKIIRSLAPDCDAEALRVVREMPKWKPARLNGKPVRAYFNLPIKFSSK